MSSPNRFQTLKLLPLLSALIITLAAVGTSQNAADATALELGQSVERELSGSQTHSFRVNLDEGAFARVVLVQQGIDTIVQLTGSEGKSGVDFDSELRSNGEEKIEFVSATAGEQHLLVKAKYPLLPAGRFEIRLQSVRAATEDERLLDEARRLRTKAWQLRMADKYIEGFPLAEKALELQERVLGTEHADLAFTLFVLAVISEFKIDYPKAEAFYLRGHSVAEKALGRDHPLLGRLYSAAAYFYFRHRGDYSRAEDLYKRGLAIRETALGPDHPDVSRSVRDLGFLSLDTGDYVRAEDYLQRAIEISRKAFGEEHVEVALATMYLAGTHSDKGDYASAELLFKRSLSYLEKAFGPASGWAGIGIKNLAGLYLTMEEYDKAEELFLRSLSIDEKGNPPDHPDILRVRHELSTLYFRTGKLAKFDAVSKDLLPAIEKRFGDRHRYVGLHLHLLAKAAIARDDLKSAEDQLRRSISVLESAVGPRYHALAEVLLDLSAVCSKQGNLSEAVALQERSGAIREYNFNINLATGSERQKLAYLAVLPDHLDQAVALHSRLADGRTRELVANAMLRRKGRVQDAMSNSLGSLRKRLDPNDLVLLDRLGIVTARLARLALDGPGEVSLADHQARMAAAEKERETLESEISRRASGAYQRPAVVEFKDVRSAIQPGEALIEFATYDRSAAGNPESRGELRYIASVLSRSGGLQLKDLGPASAIDSQIANFRKAVRDPRRTDARTIARTIDEMVMRPLREMVGESQHLLISPDGDLNLVPFEAFVDESGRHLIENYSITYLTSGRDLLRSKPDAKPGDQLAVVADPVFGEPDGGQLIAGSGIARKRPMTNRRSITNTRDLSETYFASLSGTALEAASIKSLFPGASMLTGNAATETAVKALARPKMLHIATHGYFLDEGSSGSDADARTPGPAAAIRRPENPLLRSGLAFAGANRRDGAVDDGILTALEASGMNLWGTKLVVLSACDTGLGEIKNGEGVYGLRRSFVLAGAESLVMSLWPVSDQVTRELMTGYYRNLKNGMGRGEAMRQVQLEMIKRPNRKHPFYWASFIQSGEWANLNGKR